MSVSQVCLLRTVHSWANAVLQCLSVLNSVYISSAAKWNMGTKIYTFIMEFKIGLSVSVFGRWPLLRAKKLAYIGESKQLSSIMFNHKYSAFLDNNYFVAG